MYSTYFHMAHQLFMTKNSSNDNIVAFTDTMPEQECSNEVLQLIILTCERSNVLGSFRGHRVALWPNVLKEALISSIFGGPYVAMRYHIGIVQDTSQEIWSCSMTPTSDGFSVVSKYSCMFCVNWFLTNPYTSFRFIITFVGVPPSTKQSTYNLYDFQKSDCINVSYLSISL